jgi:putative DNA primase/helicase
LAALPSILHYLLPAGVLRGGKFMVGNVQGDKGDSLVVEMNGAKAGLWHDFATGAGGDIIDLWAVSKDLTARRNFLHCCKIFKPTLALELIHGLISLHRLNHRGKAESSENQLPNGIIPMRTAISSPVCIGMIPMAAKNSGRGMPCAGSCVRRIFALSIIRLGLKDAALVVLAEGEKCAQALISVGICATTAMNGAKAPVNKTDWSPLQGKHVIIWPDHDEPGLEYARRAASAAARAGAVQVEILKIPPEKPPKWDAADAVAEGLDIDDHPAALGTGGG